MVRRSGNVRATVVGVATRPGRVPATVVGATRPGGVPPGGVVEELLNRAVAG